jgi:hypothetical protein
MVKCLQIGLQGKGQALTKDKIITAARKEQEQTFHYLVKFYELLFPLLLIKSSYAWYSSSIRIPRAVPLATVACVI